MRRFAEGTVVPISKTRGELDKLLREWGAGGVQWGDDFVTGEVTLRFVWKEYVARFNVKTETRESIRQRTNTDIQMEKALAARGKHEHRLLLLWIKGALNACEAGIIQPEAIFLPFLEDKNGDTVAEKALPKLAMLTAGSALKLLGAG